MYLLDTNVLSELGKLRPHGAVLAWVGSVSTSHLFVSAMTIAEIQSGIERTRQQDSIKAAKIETWLVQMIATSQVLSMDLEIARIWAKIMHGKSKSLAEDGWIAATAKHRDLTIATRNARDFEGFGVDVFNPFEDVRSRTET
jgi:predicted nucleic acid-binding protein